jgi:O-antigen ligase
MSDIIGRIMSFVKSLVKIFLKSEFFLLIFTIGLFIIPFVSWSLASITYEIPRVWFAQRWIELMVVIAFIKGLNDKKQKNKDILMVGFVWLFLIVVLISSITGVDFARSFWGNLYRNDGLFTLGHLVMFFFLAYAYWEEKWEKASIFAIALGSGFLSLWVIIDGFINWGSAVAVSFGNPNFLAGHLVVTLPFLVLSEKLIKHQLVDRLVKISVFLQITAISFTYSRAGIIGVIFFLAGWFLIEKKTSLKKVLFALLGGGILIGVIAGVIYFIGIEKAPVTFIAEGRQRIFIKGFMGFIQRPILGWGWANFDSAFASVDWPIKIMHDVYVDKAHSILMEVLVTTGIVGLFVYLIVVGRSIKNFLSDKAKSPYYLLALILFLIHSQMNIISISEELIFWLLLGISATRKRRVPAG